MALDFVADFSLLMRMTLKNSRSEFIPITEEIKFLELYLRLEQKRLNKKFSFEVVLDDELSETGLFLPPMVIQPYLENAIIHGVANSDNQNHINIRFSKSGGQLTCTIADNGIGRERAAELKNADEQRQKHESMGMQITETRMQLLNDLYDGSFGVRINDLKDERGNATGTAVEVAFPIFDDPLVDDWDD